MPVREFKAGMLSALLPAMQQLLVTPVLCPTPLIGMLVLLADVLDMLVSHLGQQVQRQGVFQPRVLPQTQGSTRHAQKQEDCI